MPLSNAVSTDNGNIYNAVTDSLYLNDIMRVGTLGDHIELKSINSNYASLHSRYYFCIVYGAKVTMTVKWASSTPNESFIYMYPYVPSDKGGRGTICNM